MDKMVLDYTFLKSLLMIDDPKHDLAESMISTFNDRTTCYIPFHIFLNVMPQDDVTHESTHVVKQAELVPEGFAPYPRLPKHHHSKLAPEGYGGREEPQPKERLFAFFR